MILGLGLVELLLIDIVTGDFGNMSSQHDQWVILNTEGTNMMAALLAETSLVFVLEVSLKNVHQFYHIEFCTIIFQMCIEKIEQRGINL